jgi:hypothetical protein
MRATSVPEAATRRLSFEGTREVAESYLRTLNDRYYVYLLCHPDGQPFYVGKGVRRRALDHEAEAMRHHPFGETNPFKCNVIRKIRRAGAEILYRIDSTFQSTDELHCLEREAELIRQFGRLHEGGCLTNLAGGIGNLSGAAPESLARHSATLSGEPSDNPDRATLNRFLLGIGPVESVPIKPVSQLARILPSTPHPSARSPTARCAYALVASACASARPLTPNVQLPRSFLFDGVRAVIENGVARDILKAGMADLVPSSSPLDEAFELSGVQIGIVADLVGEPALAAGGLL